MPDKPANTSPEYEQLWREYWSHERQARSEHSIAQKRLYHAEWQRKHLAKLKRERQVKKLHELMDLYPDEVLEHIRS